MDKINLQTLKREVEKLIPKHGTHSFEHTIRVYQACQQIGTSTGADLSILLPAALLHDIKRDGNDHAYASSVKARQIMSFLGYPSSRITAIAAVISSHSFSANRIPNSLEAKVLSDVDKLDAMGALGVYRAAMYSGEKVRPIKDFIAHFYEKLLTLKDKLYTEEAKHLAESRHNFMLDFLEQLDKELVFNS